MDPNQPQSTNPTVAATANIPTVPTPQPVQPAVPAPESAQASTLSSGNSSKGSMKWPIIVGVVLILLLVTGVGVYYFYTSQNKAATEQTTKTEQTNSQKVNVTDLTTDVNSIDLGDIDTDFQQADQNLSVI